MQKVRVPLDALAEVAEDILRRDIGWRMLKLKKLLAIRYKELYRQLGFTSSQVTIMLAMAHEQNSRSLSAAKIERDYGIETAAVSRALSQLKERGLILRQRQKVGPYNRIALTEQGYETVGVIMQKWCELHRPFAALYSAYDVDMFDRQLIKVGNTS